MTESIKLKESTKRNLDCECGSGKKYKKCCYLKENANNIVLANIKPNDLGNYSSSQAPRVRYLIKNADNEYLKYGFGVSWTKNKQDARKWKKSENTTDLVKFLRENKHVVELEVLV